MHLVLDGWTAYEYWMCVTERPFFSRVVQPGLTSFEQFSARELAKALANQPGKEGPLELLVQHPSERRRSPSIHCRCFGDKRPLPPNSIQEIGSGIYVITPELLALRLSLILPRLEYLWSLTNLLGIFAFSYFERNDLVQRDPILTKEQIALYLNNAAGIPGARSAEAALKWVVERTASPRETSVDLELALPAKLGGQGLPPFLANHVYDNLPRDATRLSGRSYLVADVAWDEDDLTLEYNSNKFHDDVAQKDYDFDKMAAMQCAGKTVIPLSTHNYNSYDSFATIVDAIRTRLNVRDRHHEALEARRRDVHEKLLAIERRQRESPSMYETARWQFLFSRLYTDNNQI